MSERVLDVQDLKVSFGKAQVLDGVTFHVDKGETVAVVGPNGAGKTTLLRALSRLNAWSGSVEFDGRPLPKKAYDVVMAGLVHTPERRRLFPGLSIRDNLELGARRLRKEPNTRAEDLERVYTLFPKLKERAGQTAGTLSGGEQQQCAIGRSLMGRPRLLLLDEPSMGLAPKLIQQIFSIIREINTQGTTVLLVEQNAQQALSVADRAYILETGSIVKEGTGRELLGDPAIKEAYLGVA
ncbi:MAG: livF [Frankiales bacterium]|nr:livF [Frankiales bacterium]